MKYDIKKRRMELGLTLEQVGAAVGVGKSTVRKWETGDIANMRRDKIEALAKVLDISPVLLTKSDVSMEFLSEVAHPMMKQRTPKLYIRVPVLGEIPAGVPIEAIEDVDEWEDLGVEYMDGHDYVGLRVRGRSMEPNYLDGDVLIVRLQDTADSGDDAVVFVNGDDATFKRISINLDGIILRPLNSDFDPLYFSNEEIEELPVRVFGIAVEFRRTIRR